MNYLSRDSAPISEEVWQRIDAEAISGASAILTARRFIEVDGPYGLGLTTLEIGQDDICRETGDDEAVAIGSRAISLPMLRKNFKLSLRRLAAAAELGQPLLLTPVSDAAEAVARREEEIIYYGQPSFNLPGLLTVEGSHSVHCSSWKDLDQALQAVLDAVTQLDKDGFIGPYALALEPALYNGLYRRYTGTDMLQVEHLGRLCKKGVFKAPIKGAVLVDCRVGRLVLGQDLHTGYAKHDGAHCELFVSESIAMLIEETKAICKITTDAGAT
jgi:uncharacterized linocin/CFP29 family protein